MNLYQSGINADAPLIMSCKTLICGWTNLSEADDYSPVSMKLSTTATIELLAAMLKLSSISARTPSYQYQ